jgi:non-ribosomal peptide synthetase component E (peptide arylation enzyme)
MLLIGEKLNRAASVYPEKEAIIFNDSTLKYSELNENVNRLANGLIKIGIGRGDRQNLEERVERQAPEKLLDYPRQISQKRV